MNNKRNYYLLLLIMFCQGFVFYGPIATLYREARGLTMYEIFLIESIFMVMMIVFEIPWGYFADRFGYKKTLIIANLIYFLSKIIFYRSYSFWGFLSERAAMALALTGITGCDTALLYSSIEEKDSEKAFGYYYAVQTAGFFTASVFSTFIIRKSMDLAAFYTIIPYGIAVIPALFLKDVKPDRSEVPSIFRSILTVFKNKKMVLFLVAISLIFEASHSITVFLNQLQYKRSQIPIGYFGLILAGMQLIPIAASKTHKVTGRLGQKRLIIIIAIILGGSSLMLAFTLSSLLSIVLIGMVTMGTAFLSPVAMDIQNKSIGLANRATMLSIYAMITDIISSGVNIAIGRAAGTSLEVAFILCSIFAFLSVILLYFYFAGGNRNEKYSC